ncbi:unnamed protein product [Microthlaspi erraticum]|uniref:Chromo domain-containing protein n=1 Tax=Microthlaspi erraticum TaxID=1685480 RepID=A0A6D2LBF7_9BRAS|nr:unnamed protein product [Microthlaspi erraticum]
MEDSQFCKAMAALVNPSRRGQLFFLLRSSLQYNFQGNVEPTEKNKSLVTQEKSKPPWQNNGGKNYSGMLKLSPAEIAEKRRLGLCYKCPEKWSRGHQCQNMMLQVFTLIDDDFVEITDEDWMDGFEEKTETSPVLMELSLCSYLGLDSPVVTKLWGDIGVDGTRVCRDVSLELQGHASVMNLVVLELGNAEIILGVDWLRTLGKCEHDWDKHDMSFIYNEKLAARFYGPFEVLEKIGEVAYRLKLPAESKIHPVFHVSQLKPVLGTRHHVSPLPDSFSTRPELVIEPEAVLDTRYNTAGHLEGLIKWKSLPEHEKTWIRASDLLEQFPELEDKLLVDEGGIVRLKNRFVRQRKRGVSHEQEEVATEAELDK